MREKEKERERERESEREKERERERKREREKEREPFPPPPNLLSSFSWLYQYILVYSMGQAIPSVCAPFMFPFTWLRDAACI